MKEVNPIRDKVILECIAKDLKESNDRDYMIFVCGLYLGRRISDILKLKVADLKKDGKIKDHIFVREAKTKKQIQLPISKELRKELDVYLKDKLPHEYIFKTRVTEHKGDYAMHRSTYYKIIKKAAAKYGLERIGCHTMRKTFGYWHYKEHKDAVILMEIFGHSDVSVTLRYIGINQKNIDDSMENFKLF